MTQFIELETSYGVQRGLMSPKSCGIFAAQGSRPPPL